MTENQIPQLLFKSLEGTITDDEKTILENWITADLANRELFDELNNGESLAIAIAEQHPDNRLAAKERIWAKIKQGRTARVIPIQRRLFFRVAVAASMILALGLGTYFIFFNKAHQQKQIANLEPAKDIQAPKVTKAMITLADGRKVAYESLTTITQGTIQVAKTPDGKIIYSGQTDEVAYNTLNNPRGSKVIDMQLPDGSHVWLNAGSSITYPLAVTGKERKVQMTGEAYFEVAHDASKPFIVSKGETNIQVLGTHFNVNAYDDEDKIKVTLLEGSVKINHSVIIKPGQQAQIGGDIKVINDADLEQVMAWKNGKFYFDNSDIQTIMRQVARWYDVDVVYENGIPGGHYNGKPSRDLSAADMLKIVEYSGVKIKIEGKKVIVMK